MGVLQRSPLLSDFIASSLRNHVPFVSMRGCIGRRCQNHASLENNRGPALEYHFDSVGTTARTQLWKHNLLGDVKFTEHHLATVLQVQAMMLLTDGTGRTILAEAAQCSTDVFDTVLTAVTAELETEHVRVQQSAPPLQSKRNSVVPHFILCIT